MSHIAGNRFDILPRARPSIAFNRTVSQPNIKDKYFLSNRETPKKGLKSELQPTRLARLTRTSNVESLWCNVCKHRKPRCLCVQRELQRTQSFSHYKPPHHNLVKDRRQSYQQEHKPNISYTGVDTKREEQAIKEAEKLARQSIIHSSLSQTKSQRLHKPQKPQKTPSQPQKPQKPQRLQQTPSQPLRRSESRSRSPRRSHRSRSPRRSHRSRSPRRSHRNKSKHNSRFRSPLHSRSPKRENSQQKGELLIDYGSSSDEEDNGPEFKQVSVTKTAKVEKFLQKNALLSRKKENAVLERPKTSTNVNLGQTSHLTEREMRYSIALDQLEKEMSINETRPSSKEIKVIKRKNDGRFLFQFSRDTNSPKIDYSKSSKRVVPIDKVWKEILVYYLATFRGDENILEKQLRQELDDYDYLPPGKFIKRGTYVKFMKKSFSNSKLEPGGFVDKCTKHSVYLRSRKSSRKKTKLNRQDNFIFVYKYDDMNDDNVPMSSKSNFRIILEGMMN